MAKWGIPQLFAMWRKSVLFTVGAISLGAEELENQLGRLLKKGEGNERGPRVKVPVRPARAAATRVGRPVPAKKAARTVRKPIVKAKDTPRSVRKVKPEPTPITPITVSESTNAL